MTEHLMGAAEVAKLLGVSRVRVHQIAAADPTFPDPVAELAAGRIWEREAIEEWARQRGKGSRPGPGTAKGRHKPGS